MHVSNLQRGVVCTRAAQMPLQFELYFKKYQCGAQLKNRVEVGVKRTQAQVK